MDFPEIKVGDDLTFKAATRASYHKATRKVNGFWNGRPTVGYNGWSNFVVNFNEIIAINGDEIAA